MKSFIFISFLLLSLYGNSQDTTKYNLTNGISVIYNKSNSSLYSFTYAGDNSINNNQSSISTNTVYNYQYNVKPIFNEWQQKTNIEYKNFFILHVFNHSLSRKISFDNSFGFGLGKWYKYGSISYAIIYQKTDYVISPTTEIFRHSIRIKCKYDKKTFALNFEYYYQPNVIDFADNIIYGNMKLVLLNQKRINFTISHNLNYRSLSTIKLIHNLSLGISTTFKK
jgi:hypothetical protein